MRKVSRNIEETNRIARLFIDEILQNKDRRTEAVVVGLSGDLGAGKTSFTQAAARHLGVKHKVNSPTFIIIKKYPIKLKGYKSFLHLDAYRLKDENELLNLGWEEISQNKENLIFIEWPEKVNKIIPSASRFIHISIGKNNYRSLEIR